jgi:hypothetical protein
MVSALEFNKLLSNNLRPVTCHERNAFPSPRCASAIQIVPLECTVNRNRAGSRLLFLAEFLESRIGA